MPQPSLTHGARPRGTPRGPSGPRSSRPSRWGDDPRCRRRGWLLHDAVEVVRRVLLRTTDAVVRQPPGPRRHVAVHSCVQPRGQRKPSSDATEARHPPAIRSTRREVVPRNVHRLGRSVPMPVRECRPPHNGGTLTTPPQRADLAFLPVHRDPRPRGRRTGRPSCTWHGDEQGATRGVEVDERRSLCTAVELSTCRHKLDADHPQRANRPGGHLTCEKGPGPQLPHV
jgi:hypothetical protein